MTTTTLKSDLVAAIEAGEITRAFLASKLKGARLVFFENGQEVETPFPPSAIILVVPPPAIADGVQEVALDKQNA